MVVVHFEQLNYDLSYKKLYLCFCMIKLCHTYLFIRRFIFLIICILSFNQNLLSQQKNKPCQISGDMGLYGDFYQMNSDTLGSVAPRRPDALGRIVVNVSINIKDFSMPISMALPTGQFGVVIPNVPKIPNAPFLNFKQLV